MLHWPTIRALVAILASSMFLAACVAEAPYVYTDYRFHQRGAVIVCYNEDQASPAQVNALAEEICRQYDRTAQFVLQQPFQCSWSAPTQVTYSCVARPGETPGPIIPHRPPMRHDPPLPPP
jgi:hypothetical protein